MENDSFGTCWTLCESTACVYLCSFTTARKSNTQTYSMRLTRYSRLKKRFFLIEWWRTTFDGFVREYQIQTVYKHTSCWFFSLSFHTFSASLSTSYLLDVFLLCALHMIFFIRTCLLLLLVCYLPFATQNHIYRRRYTTLLHIHTQYTHVNICIMCTCDRLSAHICLCTCNLYISYTHVYAGRDKNLIATTVPSIRSRLRCNETHLLL